MGFLQKIKGDVLSHLPILIHKISCLKEGIDGMDLKRLSRKQRLFLLMIGLFVIVFLGMTGKLFQKDEKIKDKKPVANEELVILGTEDSVEGLEKNQVYTDKGIYFYDEETDWGSYLYQSVQAVTEEDRILHINNLLQREVKLENCLIVENTTESITMFSEGFHISLPCRNLTAEFLNEIVDIYLTNGSVTKISTKTESLSGKILSVRADGIELEGYGVVPLSETFRFYETYGKYQEKSAYGLIVGYEQAKLIVAEGKICAAVLESPMTLERIRVLLKTTNFEEILHQNVELKAHGDYEVIYGDESLILHDGDTLKLTTVSEELTDNRVMFIPRSENARMEISSIEIIAKKFCLKFLRLML